VKQMTAIIPARAGSIGVPRKNIVPIGVHPLIAYSIVACKLSKRINRIIVSTEDEEIAEIARSYGAEVPFMRPKEYSENDSRDVEFLNHFFDNINVEEAAFIRPTTPLRSPFILDKAIDVYYENKSLITSLRSLHKANSSPFKMFGVKENICHGFFKDYNGIENYSNYPRQFFPNAYEGNGHIDIVKREVVKNGDTFGDKIYAFVVDKITDIDVPFDLEILNLQINTDKDLLTKHLRRYKNEKNICYC